MSRIGLHRDAASSGMRLRVWQPVERDATIGRQDKSAACGRAYVVVWVGYFRALVGSAGWRFSRFVQPFQRPNRHHLPIRNEQPP